MSKSFADMLLVGGKSNSLGRVTDVIDIVLDDRTKLDELYLCMFNDDPWVKMRASDAFEKVCRHHPDWIEPYVDRFPEGIAVSQQASVQWHLAQIYRQVNLTDKQREFAIGWLKGLLSSPSIDWIASANSMDTLFYFYQQGFVARKDIMPLLEVQQRHKSKSVIKRADKIMAMIK